MTADHDRRHMPAKRVFRRHIETTCRFCRHIVLRDSRARGNTNLKEIGYGW